MTDTASDFYIKLGVIEVKCLPMRIVTFKAYIYLISSHRDSSFILPSASLVLDCTQGPSCVSCPQDLRGLEASSSYL